MKDFIHDNQSFELCLETYRKPVQQLEEGYCSPELFFILLLHPIPTEVLE